MLAAATTLTAAPAKGQKTGLDIYGYASNRGFAVTTHSEDRLIFRKFAASPNLLKNMLNFHCPRDGGNVPHVTMELFDEALKTLIRPDPKSGNVRLKVSRASGGPISELNGRFVDKDVIRFDRNAASARGFDAFLRSDSVWLTSQHAGSLPSVKPPNETSAVYQLQAQDNVRTALEKAVSGAVKWLTYGEALGQCEQYRGGRA